MTNNEGRPDHEFSTFPSRNLTETRRTVGRPDHEFSTLPSRNLNETRQTVGRPDHEFSTLPSRNLNETRRTVGRPDHEFSTLPSRNLNGTWRTVGRSDHELSTPSGRNLDKKGRTEGQSDHELSTPHGRNLPELGQRPIDKNTTSRSVRWVAEHPLSRKRGVPHQGTGQTDSGLQEPGPTYQSTKSHHTEVPPNNLPALRGRRWQEHERHEGCSSLREGAANTPRPRKEGRLNE
jgi:hypothetical protein